MVTSAISMPLFASQFTGIMVYDPVSGDTVYRHNSDKYFTPASNTKIFTLYACLRLLPKAVPALKYREHRDTLFIQGTGDPSQLHPYFRDSTVLHFIGSYPTVALYSGNFNDLPWGPGWAWEDYDGYYAPERTALPLYGNVVEVFRRDSLVVQPSGFRDKVYELGYPWKRKREQNTFFFDPSRKDTLLIPFKTDTSLTRALLEQASGRKILHAPQMPVGEVQILYSLPADSLYKRMMQQSDNFLAEQLLLTASSTLSDTLDGALVRKFVLDSLITALRQPPVWVDGSGLSRYNLFSPESMVDVLNRMYHEVPSRRLFEFFAAGGVSGTLKDWYAGETEPYVFAKTGTLANNHCVSGYLKTRSGRILIFSFMNNHFLQPSPLLKTAMQQLFEGLRDAYEPPKTRKRYGLKSP